MEYSEKTIALAESVGNFIEYWGFRAIDGKIWLLIFISDFPVDAKILIKHLKVTKGMISLSIKTLVEYDLIQEVEYGDNRSKYYKARFDPLQTVVNVLSRREMILIRDVRTKFKELEASKEFAGIDPKLLKQVGRLIKLGELILEGVIKLKKVDFSPWKNR